MGLGGALQSTASHDCVRTLGDNRERFARFGTEIGRRIGQRLGLVSIAERRNCGELGSAQRRHSGEFHTIQFENAPKRLMLLAGCLTVLLRPAVAQIAENGDPVRLSLRQCIAIALQSQPAIGVQQSALAVAREQQVIARSLFFPQAGFGVRYTLIDEPRSVDIPSPLTGPIADVFSDSAAFFSIARQAGSAAANLALDSPNTAPFSTAKQAALVGLPESFRTFLLGENFLTTELTLVQPLWTGGKISYRHQQARFGAELAASDLTRSEQQTTFAVTRAYLGILLAQELGQAAEQATGHFQAVERLVQSLLDEAEEYVTTADLYRARSIRFLAQGERLGLEQAQAIARALLRQAMGVEQTAPFHIADTRLVAGQTSLQLDTLLEQALCLRPELAKAEHGVQIARLGEQLAQAEFYPDVSLYARFGTIHDDRNFANPNDPQEWATGIALEVPLFTGGRRFAQQRQAAHQHYQAYQFEQLVRNTIRREVQQAYLKFVEASQRLPLSSQALSNARDAVDRYHEQYSGDQILDEDLPEYFEDLLTTELLLWQARTRYYRDVHGYNLSLANLRLVTASDEYQTVYETGDSGPALSASDAGLPGGGAAAQATSGGSGPALFQPVPRRQWVTSRRRHQANH